MKAVKLKEPLSQTQNAFLRAKHSTVPQWHREFPSGEKQQAVPPLQSLSSHTGVLATLKSWYQADIFRILSYITPHRQRDIPQLDWRLAGKGTALFCLFCKKFSHPSAVC